MLCLHLRETTPIPLKDVLDEGQCTSACYFQWLNSRSAEDPRREERQPLRVGGGEAAEADCIPFPAGPSTPFTTAASGSFKAQLFR